jgi:hypothetical protein
MKGLRAIAGAWQYSSGLWPLSKEDLDNFNCDSIVRFKFLGVLFLLEVPRKNPILCSLKAFFKTFGLCFVSIITSCRVLDDSAARPKHLELPAFPVDTSAAERLEMSTVDASVASNYCSRFVLADGSMPAGQKNRVPR